MKKREYHLYLTPILSFLALSLLLLLPFSVAHGQLVPCGDESTPCTTCHLFQLASNVITFLLLVIIPLAVLAIVVGGFFLLASAGRESWRTRGKSILWSGIGGVIISYGAWLIINTIIVSIVEGGVFISGQPWNNFPGCS